MTRHHPEADVVVGVPVYRGADVVAETLQSIRDQTYPHYRVVISVDADDRASAAACEAFLDDPRFEMVVHESHLGWHGNFNWLASHADLPFYCYWQQDDLAEPNFLESLRAEMLTHPDTAIAHADIQWFGARTDRQSSASIVGRRTTRLAEHILRLSHVPLLGMWRTAFIDKERGLLADTPEESSQQEFVFLARMAAAGAFRRVDDTLYLKRAGEASTHLRFQTLPEARRRREWIAMGAGLIEVASEVFRPSRLPTVAEFVAERLAIHLPDRDYFYLPAPLDLEITRFVVELLSEAPSDPVRVPRRRRNALLRRASHPAVRAGVALAQKADEMLSAMSASISTKGKTSVPFGASEDGMALLGQGWSVGQQDGVWSHSDEATVLLPELPEGRWAMTVRGYPRPSPPDVPTTHIGWALGPDEPYIETIDASDQAGIEFEFEADGSRRGGTLRLAFPDAASPASLGMGDDPRHLGFFMSSLSISRR